MIPTKQQLDIKWWHRFFKVILMVSTVIMFFILIAFISNQGGFDWQKSKYVYSFEKDYNKYEENEENCFYVEAKGKTPPIGKFIPLIDQIEQKYGLNGYTDEVFKCGDLARGAFETRYCESKPTDTICHRTLDEKLTAVRLKSDPELERIINFEGVKFKFAHYWSWGNILRDIFLLIAMVIGWIVLLKYGIYKAILYVVYGKK